MTSSRSSLKKTIPVSLVILAIAFLTGMMLALYGYSQDRALPLSLGVGLSLFGAFFGVIRIAVWGDDH